MELYKKGEPLGITITGSEDSRLPISIQELSPGKNNTIEILYLNRCSCTIRIDVFSQIR